MKNVSKNKFLTSCFRPVVDDDIDTMLNSDAVVDRSASRRFACNPVASDKHDTECSKLTQSQVVRLQPPKRTLSKNSTKAHKKNRYSQSCFGSRRSYSASTYRESSSTGDDEKSTVRLASVDTNIKEIKALELSRSSSSSGLRVSESKSFPKCESTKGQLEKQQNKFKCLGIYVVLISLVITVIWGKINVMILGSILFCCCSLWNTSSRRLKWVAKLSSTESTKAHKNAHHNRRTG